MPILPFVVESYGAPEWVYGLLLTCYSAFQFIGAPFLGALSDSSGRKPILLVSQAGTLLAWLVFLLALFLPNNNLLGLAVPIWIIMLSRILDGITGGNTSVANAYVADITTREEKSYIFGYLGGIAGIGMIIGPGLGGLAASTSLGYKGTILVAVAISTITLLAISFWLKESLPLEERRERKKHNIWHSLFIPGRIKAANPRPNNVKANPVATGLAYNRNTNNAKMDASKAPAKAAAKTETKVIAFSSGVYCGCHGHSHCGSVVSISFSRRVVSFGWSRYVNFSNKACNVC